VGGVAGAINAHTQDGDSNMLANPRIRVRNREKAKVVIGEKLPVITTTISPGVGGFASESVSYAEVGLTLNVEPTIQLDNEVAIRISLEVSNVVDSAITKSGSTVYRLGNRSASTLLQLKDGENQVLAGLIRNDDRTSGSKLPILGSLPLLGRLFGTTNDSSGKTEIVLSITPHLVRNIQRPPAEESEFSAGTDATFRRRPDTVGFAPAPPAAPAPSQAALAAQPVPGTGAAQTTAHASASGAWPVTAAGSSTPVSQLPASQPPQAADAK
jgi:general secretion pathway protein D